MEKTAFLENYNQEECRRLLSYGVPVGVVGKIPPKTDKIDLPHKVRKVENEGKVIGFIIEKFNPPKSDNWDKYFDIVQKNPNKRVPGFPFSARWPSDYAGKKYKIIVVSGKILEATVDNSREDKGELYWNTGEGKKMNFSVAAWQEI